MDASPGEDASPTDASPGDGSIGVAAPGSIGVGVGRGDLAGVEDREAASLAGEIDDYLEDLEFDGGDISELVFGFAARLDEGADSLVVFDLTFEDIRLDYDIARAAVATGGAFFREEGDGERTGGERTGGDGTLGRLGEFELAVENRRAVGERGVVDAIHALAGPSGGRVFVTLKRYQKYILRFLIGLYSAVAVGGVVATAAAGPLSLVITALAGAAVAGCAAMLRASGGRGKTFRAERLSGLLGNRDDVGTASTLLLSSMASRTDPLHRIYTAAFLYFVSHVDPDDPGDAALIESAGPALALMHPLTKSSGFRIHASVRETARGVLEAHAGRIVPSAPGEDAVYNTVFPPLTLVWHELVTGAILRALFYCAYSQTRRARLLASLRGIKHPWSTETLARHLASVSTETSSDCDSLDPLKVGRFYRSRAADVRLVKREQSMPDHVLVLVDAHGAIDDSGPNIVVPDNVTMVKVGIAGRDTLPAMQSGDAFHCKMRFDRLTRDHAGGGSDVVPPNSVYPEVFLRGAPDKEYRAFRCDTETVLHGFGPSPTRLSDVLRKASESAASSGHMALVVVNSCQKTCDVNRVSVGTDTVFSALATLPSRISVVGFGAEPRWFDVAAEMLRGWSARRESAVSERAERVLADPRLRPQKKDKARELHEESERRDATERLERARDEHEIEIEIGGDRLEEPRERIWREELDTAERYGAIKEVARVRRERLRRRGEIAAAHFPGIGSAMQELADEEAASRRAYDDTILRTRERARTSGGSGSSSKPNAAGRSAMAAIGLLLVAAATLVR
jgi:hypothetical protein